MKMLASSSIKFAAFILCLSVVSTAAENGALEGGGGGSYSGFDPTKFTLRTVKNDDEQTDLDALPDRDKTKPLLTGSAGNPQVMTLPTEDEFVASNDSVKMTVFYDSYCPYCKRFIGNQLVPIWRQMKDHIELDLIPFGLAVKNVEDDGTTSLECLHGQKECVADTLHACAIHAACGEQGTLQCHGQQKNLTKAIDYLGCLIGQKDQRQESDRCAVEAGLDASEMNACASGPLGERLADEYSSRKWNGRRVQAVPFVAFNGKYSYEVLVEAVGDLKKVVCKNIPQHCQ